MKATIITLAIVAMVATGGMAQIKPAVKGSWVVECNTHQRRLQTVKFYGDSNQLLYTETIKGRLNIDKKKVRERLDKVLDILLAKDSSMQNKGLLAAVSKLKL